MNLRGILTLALSALVVLFVAGSAGASLSAAKMVTHGNAEINGVAAPAVTSAFVGDRISTGKEATSSLSFSGGDTVLIPELSKAALGLHDGRLVLDLEEGTVSVSSKSATPIVVMAHGARIMAAGNQPGSFSVTLHGNALHVVPSAGAARVETANRTGEIQPGTALDATLAPNLPSPQGNSFAASTTTWIIVGLTAAAVGGGIAAWELTQGSSSPIR